MGTIDPLASAARRPREGQHPRRSAARLTFGRMQSGTTWRLEERASLQGAWRVMVATPVQAAEARLPGSRRTFNEAETGYDLSRRMGRPLRRIPTGR